MTDATCWYVTLTADVVNGWAVVAYDVLPTCDIIVDDMIGDDIGPSCRRAYHHHLPPAAARPPPPPRQPATNIDGRQTDQTNSERQAFCTEDDQTIEKTYSA